MFSTKVFALLILALSPTTTLAAPHPRPHSEISSYALPGNNSYPEGVARQPNSPYFYAGSVTTGSIYRGSVYNPQMEVWVPTTPSPALTGIKIDYQDRLYVAGYTSGSLFVYDIPTRELLYTFTVSYNGSGLNDLIIADDGTVYITDSSQPFLLYITPDQLTSREAKQELKIYKDISADIPYIYGPGVPVGNGIVVTEDQEFLIVGSWGGRAIYRVCLKTKEVSLIDLGGKTIGNVDGLLLRGDTLYSVNSGYELGLFIDVLKIEYPYLEANPVGNLTSDLLYGPSTAAFDGDDMLVANLQNGNANIHLPFDIVRIPLYQKE